MADHDNETATRFNPSNPCPVCGEGTKSCSVTVDGYHRCRGKAGPGWVCVHNAPGEFSGYRRAGESSLPNGKTPKLGTGKASGIGKAGREWSKEIDQFERMLNNHPEFRERLAEVLGGLPSESLAAFRLGIRDIAIDSVEFTIPERDGSGSIIGVATRVQHKSGRVEKKAIKGSRRGLTIPAGWESQDPTGPIIAVEGFSGAAAMFAAGLCAIGRPGADNASATNYLAELFTGLPVERPIIIAGDNDTNNAGQAGAEECARELSKRLNRPVLFAVVPESVKRDGGRGKDVRDWLTAPARGEMPWPDRGRELAAHFAATAVEPAANNEPGRFAGDKIENCHRLACLFLAHITPGGASPYAIRFYHDEFFQYDAGAYRPIPDSDLKANITEWIRAEFLRAYTVELAAWSNKSDKNDDPPTVRNVPARLVSDVLQAMRGMALIPGSFDSPSWIDDMAAAADRFDPSKMIAAPNGIIDLPAVAHGKLDCLLPSDRRFFTTAAVPFGFDAAARCPDQWFKFLCELWPDSPSSIVCLQEWAGYLLTSDTSLQKLLSIIGPKRAGKGTILRVFRELVGPRNVVSPTLGSLAGEFGLQPLLGKSVAMIADARIGGRIDSHTIVERLLSISGEDAQTVNRKHREMITTKLPTRFVIATNEIPRLPDASGALAGRFIILRLTKSFFDREDSKLTDRLLTELPGIFRWAIAGWKRLQERGRFVQPHSGTDLVRELEDLASPINEFLRERCSVGASEDHKTRAGHLYSAWKSWCETHGRREPGTEQTFGRDLRSCIPSLEVERPREIDGTRFRQYHGVRLLNIDEPPQEEPRRSADHADQATFETAFEPFPVPSGPHGPRTLLLHAERNQEKDADEVQDENIANIAHAMARTADHADQRGPEAVILARELPPSTFHVNGKFVSPTTPLGIDLPGIVAPQP